MNLHYRTAAHDDIEKMSAQLADSYIHAYKGLMSKEYLSSITANHWIPVLEESMQKGDSCLIAEINGEIIGSSVFSVTQEAEKTYAEWHAFYLSPSYISHGIGHSFYQVIESEMKRNGCRFCILEVLSSNERAIKFYLTRGYVKTSTFVVEENGMTLSCDTMIKWFD